MQLIWLGRTRAGRYKHPMSHMVKNHHHHPTAHTHGMIQVSKCNHCPSVGSAPVSHRTVYGCCTRAQAAAGYTSVLLMPKHKMQVVECGCPCGTDHHRDHGRFSGLKQLGSYVPRRGSSSWWLSRVWGRGWGAAASPRPARERVRCTSRPCRSGRKCDICSCVCVSGGGDICGLSVF
jgi:hypothetical protein